MTDQRIERQRRHFEGIAGEYTRSRGHPNHLLCKQLIWSHFLSRHRDIRPACVLEPMCGLGEGRSILIDHLGAAGFDYLGFDYSSNMVEEARKRHPDLRFDVGDVSRFEADGQRWDFIVLIGGLHHVFALSEEVVRRLAAAQPPGAHFLSFEPTQACWLTRRVREAIYKRNAIFDDDSEQGFEYDDLERQFELAGYEKRDQVFAGLSAYTLYYNPDAFPWLNLGGQWAVRAFFALDRLFWRNAIGRKLSFATITLWRKRSSPDAGAAQ